MRAALPVVRVGAVVSTACSMVMLNCSLSEPPLLLAVTVKLDVLCAVGVPEMTPVFPSKVRPAGRSPLLLHVMVPVPLAARVAVYAVPTVPPAREVVVIRGGAVP